MCIHFHKNETEVTIEEAASVSQQNSNCSKVKLALEPKSDSRHTCGRGAL